ncbi:S-layer homology domain-containing protein [Brevibacillus sp. SYP-B805]|uniref:S-layer homology domain-containing protein n=1 Tax=Brevibacillus sp. SYP-B805 TaxID=1578199 RepID=UPI0013EDB96C|nr:S-layer homology domain-containing protein [Brevibacillus sp. SYP-B805]NGQ96377.1 S-layer homology domain-containing protein [Brevibacillus sp. SYP-B805]
MRRLFAFFLTAILILTAMPLAQAAVRFADVPSSHWAYKEITEMAEKGIIKGYSDGRFRPNNHVTRAEFAKIMIAAADIDIGEKKSQTFQDVPRSHWAFDYVEYAKPYLTGYKSGSRYYYKPDEDAVREDIAVALVRLLGYDRTKKADLSVISKFRDDDRISPALRPYVAIAIQTDLIKGYDGYFRPQDAITRAEAASLIYRALLEKRDDDESKVVFPVPTPPQTPELPVSVTDSFSNADLANWQKDKANASWGVVNKAVTALTTNTDIDHYFLPLKWREELKPTKYQLEVDVLPKGTAGLGGLFFNGTDGKGHVVFVSDDKVTVGYVSDDKSKDLSVIATSSYKLRSSNRLKVVVDGNRYDVYLNGAFVFGQQNVSLTGTKLGLYLQREATKDVPDKITYLDNFSFKVLQ